MSDKDLYLKYIGYSINSVFTTIGDLEWKDFILDTYKGKIDSTKNLKDLALRFYYADILTDNLMVSDKISVLKKTPEDLRDTIVAFEKFAKEHKLPMFNVTYHKKFEKVLEHIDSPQYKGAANTLEKIIAKPIKKKTATKSKSTVTKKKTAAKPKTTKRSSPVKKTKLKKSTTVSAVVSKKICDRYKVDELKKLAAEKGLSGYSKMKKEELCENLGIKRTIKASTTTSSAKKITKKKVVSSASRADLYKLAQAKNITGRAKMSKEELIKALKIKK
jgi:hypothetical protein